MSRTTSATVLPFAAPAPLSQGKTVAGLPEEHWASVLPHPGRASRSEV
jgi:hypothetical protein